MTRTRSSGKAPDKFQADDRVFAKVKGWPPWPAKVLNRVEGKGESYNVLFYGTYDTRVLKLDSLFIYNKANKAEYGKSKNRNRWKEAMEEIDKNIPIGEGGPVEEKTPTVELAKSPVRKGAKATISKRDSISSSSSTTEVSTPPPATTTTTTPGSETVRRSGRQVKPKRFADDEISSPISSKSKSSNQGESSEGPPSKRAKRGEKKTATAVESDAETSNGENTTTIAVVQQNEDVEKSTTVPNIESIPSPLKTPDSSVKKVSLDAMMAAVSSIKSPVVVSPAPKPDVSGPPKSKPKGDISAVQTQTPKLVAATPAVSQAQKSVTIEVETGKPKGANTTVVVQQQKEDVEKSTSVPNPESNLSPVKPSDSSARKVSLEAMMAVVSSIKTPVLVSSMPKPDMPGLATPKRKPKVESTQQQLKPKAKPLAASIAGTKAPPSMAVEIVTEKSKGGNTTVVVVGQKGGTEKSSPVPNSEFSRSPLKPTDSSMRKVSLEAMMAAVSSIKTPVVSSSTPKPNMSGLPKPKPKVEMSSIPLLKSKAKLVAATPPAASQGQQPVAVEIVREKSMGGNTTVVLVQQQHKEDIREGDDVVLGDHDSDADSYDEYMYFDREFEFEQEEDTKTDREFETFHSGLKKFLQLPGTWTMGGVQWDPQGKRKVILISEPEIPPNGRPCVKRCLQFFEDKSIRVFIDQMDMTDVFGMTCYAEKEDVASLIVRVADVSSCCGVPEMVVDDLVHFPDVRKRNTSYFAPTCPGVIPNDEYDPICTACKDLQVLVKESRIKEKLRLQERRLISEQKMFQHPFGQALYTMFNDLVDETDPTKPRKKRTKETFFRKFLHDTRLKVNGDTARTERVYIEKPISVDSVSQSFQDIVSKLGFNMPNAKKKTSGSMLPRPATTHTSTPRSSSVSRLFPGSTSNLVKMDRKQAMQMEHILPFTPGSSFTLDDGQEYELIGEVEPSPEFVEMKPTPTSNQQQQQQFEIIEVDDETLARLASSSKNQMVVLPESGAHSGFPITTRIDANDPNLSQILKAINTSHGFKVS